MRNFYYYLLILVICNACALSKSQVKAVNQFAKLTESYSAYPKAIVEEYIELNHDVRLMDIGTFSSKEKSWGQIVSAGDNRDAQLKAIRELDLSIKIIDTYAQNLKVLTSEDFYKSLDEPSEKLGNNLDTLIARYNDLKGDQGLEIGIGKLIGKAVLTIGKTFIKAKQAKFTKEFVQKADPLIGTVTGNIEKLLHEQVVSQWIPSETRNLKNKHGKLFDSISFPATDESDLKITFGRVDHYRSGYILRRDLGQEVSDRYLKILKLETSAKAVAKSIKELRTAHHKLAKEVKRKKKFEEAIPELVKLGSALSDVYDAYNSLSKDETN